MQTYYMTDIGRSRSNNQDFVYCSTEPVGKFPNVFVVADGMGGHNAGDTASRTGVEQIVRQIRESENITIVSIWEDALDKANQYVFDMAQSQPELEGMGTTIVGAVVMENTAYVINVGDSRMYLLRDSLSQITEDHSLVGEMVRSGEIKKDEMRTHPNKNIITRALGTKESVKADCFEVELKPGDVLLLCSDGLSNMLEDSQMEEIIRSCREPDKGMECACRRLVESANDAGGKDNISVILIEI